MTDRVFRQNENKFGLTMTLPEAKSDTAALNEKRAAAATRKFHRSPTLIRAVSSRYPTPLPSHLRVLAWFIALIVPSFFYIGPIMLLLPPILYCFSPTVALVVFLADILLVTYPMREWPWIRGIFQLWYELFDFHHNLDVNPNATSSQLTALEENSLLICAMHPHGTLPVQAFLWIAFCDQYLPKSYGFGAVADIATRIPLLRQVLGWASGGSASRHILQQRLQTGTNLFILPGGVALLGDSNTNIH